MDNQVFGKNAEAAENDINLESEDFNFYRQNKEKAKKDIDNSAKELTDFIDGLIADIPEPSQEEIDAGIEKLIKKTHAEGAENKPVKSKRSKKVMLKVLFLAAVLSAVCFTSLFAVGNSRNVSIDNGFISFAKETVQVVFFGEDEKEFISVDTLLKDLEKHGYKDILFPEIFITNSDEYKVSLPEYLEGTLRQVVFDIHCGSVVYKYGIYSYNPQQQSFGYIDIENMKMVTVDDISVSVTEYEKVCVAEFVSGDYRYFIESDIPYSELVSIINTIN
ncbi:MAG: hypothetical protein UHM85_10950 [Acutalibacteraceae bacterium]|nr:hypothetical protein [Acutalibacteraceae bacterium]